MSAAADVESVEAQQPSRSSSGSTLGDADLRAFSKDCLAAALAGVLAALFAAVALAMLIGAGDRGSASLVNFTSVVLGLVVGACVFGARGSGPPGA
jgi:hypothetical protein